MFLALWSRSRLKKNHEPEPEPLGKSQEPEPLKNKPAPQPCEKIKKPKEIGKKSGAGAEAA